MACRLKGANTSQALWAAGLALAGAGIGAAPPQELPTRWEAPPGDALEHAAAGFAKVLCSAVFITGRDPAVAAEEDGFFVASREERRQVTKTVVDRERRAVHVTIAAPSPVSAPSPLPLPRQGGGENQEASSGEAAASSSAPSRPTAPSPLPLPRKGGGENQEASSGEAAASSSAPSRPAAPSPPPLSREGRGENQAAAVSPTPGNFITRTARQFGDQGCVTLPRGSDSVQFTPLRVVSALPDPATLPWPMGDVLPDAPLPPAVKAAKLKEAVAAAFEPEAALTAAFVVVHRGRLIAERYQAGLDQRTRLPGWSMGKSITATLIGRLIHQGRLELWAPAPVAEWQGVGDPRRGIRVADLLRMSSGLRFVSPLDPDFDPSAGHPDHLYVYTGASDAFRWAVTRPPQWPPNTVGRYRNSDPLVLGYLVKQAAAARDEEYLSWPQRQLFDKLGIRGMVLETDPHGNFLLQGYELAPARDWARLGMLYLQDGVWKGERLLPEGWSEFVRTPAPAWDAPVYGAMFWLNRTRTWPVPEDAYYMAGAGGQFTLIIPSNELVVVRLGHYKGGGPGQAALRRALALLMEAVPRKAGARD